jgi:hypothetical protein
MLGTSPILGISGIRTSEEIFMNANVTVSMCKFSIIPSIGTMVYFGVIVLAVSVCIVAAIFLYIPVLKELHISTRFSRSATSNNDSESGSTVITEMKSMTLTKSDKRELKSSAANDSSKSQLSSSEASQKVHLRAHASHSENSCEDQPSHSTLRSDQDVVKDKIKNSKRGRPKRKSVQRRLTMMFLLLILIFIISYIPPLVILILTYTIEDFNFIKLSKTKAMIWIYVRHLLLLNHVINPFIYGYYDTQLRKQLISCFKRRMYIV